MTAPLPRQSEADFQRAVEQLAKLRGWRVMHVGKATVKAGRWTTPTSEPGWPDLVCLRGDRLVFAELKSDRGRLTEAQRDYLDQLAAVRSVETFVWRPSDLTEIVLTLGGAA